MLSSLAVAHTFSCSQQKHGVCRIVGADLKGYAVVFFLFLVGVPLLTFLVRVLNRHWRQYWASLSYIGQQCLQASKH